MLWAPCEQPGSPGASTRQGSPCSAAATQRVSRAATPDQPAQSLARWDEGGWARTAYVSVTSIALWVEAGLGHDVTRAVLAPPRDWPDLCCRRYSKLERITIASVILIWWGGSWIQWNARFFSAVLGVVQSKSSPEPSWRSVGPTRARHSGWVIYPVATLPPVTTLTTVRRRHRSNPSACITAATCPCGRPRCHGLLHSQFPPALAPPGSGSWLFCPAPRLAASTIRSLWCQRWPPMPAQWPFWTPPLDFATDTTGVGPHFYRRGLPCPQNLKNLEEQPRWGSQAGRRRFSVCDRGWKICACRAGHIPVENAAWKPGDVAGWSFQCLLGWW